MHFMNFDYARSSIGVLKIIHILVGIVSLILVSTSFVSGVSGNQLLLATVSTCLVISIVYLLAYFRCRELSVMKANQQLEFIYHVIGALFLVISGIDWEAWTNYSELCHDNCPFALLVFAKITAFLNGILYGIVAFANIRAWKSINPEEDIHLLKPNSLL